MTGDATVVPSDHYVVMADIDLHTVGIGGGRGLEAWTSEAKDKLWASTGG